MFETNKEVPSRPTVLLDPIVVASMRGDLRAVAAEVVSAVVTQVPSYRDAFAGPMGRNIQDAVALALDGFLELSTREAEVGEAVGPVVEGAYALGRGEARAGRTMEALLAAYRVGARVAWRALSDNAVAAGLPATQVAHFAELVFAYIDQLSAASAAGHADEAETAGRVRQRLLERLARQLVDGTPPESVDATARRAEYTAPRTLTAVLLPVAEVRATLPALAKSTLAMAEDLPGVDRGDLEDVALLLVPDVRRPALLRALEGRSAVVGSTVSWREGRASYRRALRAYALDPLPAGPGARDADVLLTRLVLSADPDAHADLCRRVLAPLADLKPAAAEKLTETLRVWLLTRGRREEVAQVLHVHPQTVRYRVGQLRELFGERLDEPDAVLDLVVALGPLPLG